MPEYFSTSLSIGLVQKTPLFLVKNGGFPILLGDKLRKRFTIGGMPRFYFFWAAVNAKRGILKRLVPSGLWHLLGMG